MPEDPEQCCADPRVWTLPADVPETRHFTPSPSAGGGCVLPVEPSYFLTVAAVHGPALADHIESAVRAGTEPGPRRQARRLTARPLRASAGASNVHRWSGSKRLSWPRRHGTNCSR